MILIILGKAYGELINVAMSDIPADMTVTMHLCRGNYKSTFMGGAATTPCRKCCSTRSRCTATSWNTIPTAPAASSCCAIPRRTGSRCSGWSRPSPACSKAKPELERRIAEAAKFTDLKQLCLSPQCGFASTEEGNALAEDEQWAKLRTIVEVAQEVWEK